MSSVAAPSLGVRLDVEFFARPVGQVAPDLIGCELLVDGVGGTIVEVERYQEDDPASHSYGGPRGRAAVMFGPPGTIYVYRSYGVHWCVNLVCEPEGGGAAVLIRALEPRWGLRRMRERRLNAADRMLCAGPGRLTVALDVDGRFDGESVLEEAGTVSMHARAGTPAIVRGPRVGITRAAARPWRYGLAGSPFVSRRFPSP